jgi:biopolymer transport protein ExbD
MDFIRPKRSSSGIDMAPLIDCVFLLLIFFMLSSSFLQPAIPLQLPKSTSTILPDPERIVLSINEAGELFVNDTRTDMAALGDALMTLTGGDTSRTILFRGDRAMRYELFMEVVTTTRAAGFQKLSLQHEPAATANEP